MKTCTGTELEAAHSDIQWLRDNERWHDFDAEADWALVEAKGGVYTYVDAGLSAVLCLYPQAEPNCRPLDASDEDPGMLYDSLFPGWREVGLRAAFETAAA